MSLQLTALTKAFGAPPKIAVADVSLEVPEGSFTAIVGPSGSGKSTLLRMIGGLTEPTSGQVRMGGRSPNELRRRKQVGWMAQRPALLPWRTVEDNIRLAQTINRRPERPLPEPRDLLEMVGLSSSAGAYPSQLSGGMQQRVALARTLAIGAPLWLMDEPFASLDELTREALADDLLAVWSEVRSTVVWVTHHVPEAVTLADRILVLTPSPGRVAGMVEMPSERPRYPVSATFQGAVAEVRSLLRLERREVVA